MPRQRKLSNGYKQNGDGMCSQGNGGKLFHPALFDRHDVTNKQLLLCLTTRATNKFIDDPGHITWLLSFHLSHSLLPTLRKNKTVKATSDDCQCGVMVGRGVPGFTEFAMDHNDPALEVRIFVMGMCMRH